MIVIGCGLCRNNIDRDNDLKKHSVYNQKSDKIRVVNSIRDRTMLMDFGYK